MSVTTAVDELLDGIESASIPQEVFHSDVVLDATVPNWRFSVRGAEAVRAELGRWYADPGQFVDIRRSPIAGGELVEFTLGWEEHGVAHTCHQAHVLELRDGRVAADTVFCGGRWPASLMAEMQAAQQAAG
jgi:hypothetical protein